jgi:hypothetical protein
MALLPQFMSHDFLMFFGASHPDFIAEMMGTLNLQIPIAY